MFDLELLAKLLNHLPIQEFPIIYNDLPRYVVAIDDVQFQESSHHSFGDAFIGSGFHPLGEVIDRHQDIFMPIGDFRNQGLMKSIPQAKKGHGTTRECKG